MQGDSKFAYIEKVWRQEPGFGASVKDISIGRSNLPQELFRWLFRHWKSLKISAIEIVELKTPIEWSYSTRPACLPASKKLVKNYGVMFYAGFGLTEEPVFDLDEDRLLNQPKLSQVLKMGYAKDKTFYKGPLKRCAVFQEDVICASHTDKPDILGNTKLSVRERSYSVHSFFLILKVKTSFFLKGMNGLPLPVREILVSAKIFRRFELEWGKRVERNWQWFLFFRSALKGSPLHVKNEAKQSIVVGNGLSGSSKN